MDKSFSGLIPSSKAWSITFSLFLVILGTASALIPILTTFTLETWLPWMFIGVATFRLIYALSTFRDGLLFFKLLLPLLYIAVGLSITHDSFQGLDTVTLLLSIFLIFEGGLGLITAFQIQSFLSWTWLLVDAVLACLIGIIFWIGFSAEIPWLLQVLIGIRVIIAAINRFLMVYTTRWPPVEQ